MTNATVLANALVGAGILHKVTDSAGTSYSIPPLPAGLGMYAEIIITDWRVAGKVLESLTAETLSIVLWTAVTTPGEPLPRAIIEAWYASQNDSNEPVIGSQFPDDYEPEPPV